jgi:SanA protein
MARMSRSSVVGGAMAVLSGFAGAAVMNWWIARYARGFCFSHVAELPPRQVAIVLGAKVHPDGSPSTALEDRLEAALELWRAELVSEVLVSGDAHATEHDEPVAMRQWLIDHGVPRDRVRCDAAGFRTLDSMQRAASVFDVPSAVVCTQSFHLPRAVFLARRAGIDAVGLAANGRYRSRADNHVREVGARAVAFIESYVLQKGLG